MNYTQLPKEDLPPRDDSHLYNEEPVPVGEGGHAVNAASVANSGVRMGALGRQTVVLSQGLETVDRGVLLEPVHSLAQLVDLAFRKHVDVLTDQCRLCCATFGGGCRVKQKVFFLSRSLRREQP